MKKSIRKKIIIVGGGPSGMMAAIELSKHHDVHLYEKGKTLGRKFLVAGKGGFNLSNHLTGNDLISKYTPEKLLYPILNAFDSTNTRSWLQELGIETYIGSSGRIFPEKGIKPIDVLNALKNRILDLNGVIHYEHELIDFDSERVTLKHNNTTTTENYDACIFALGGASWSITGSKGDWLPMMAKNDITTLPFAPSNCGLEIDFNQDEISKHIGTPIKNIRISISSTVVKGEAVITKYGLEGNAIYPISRFVREELKKNTSVSISIDLKPFNTEDELLSKLSETTQPKNYGYLFKLNKAQISFIKTFTNKETYLHPESFVKAIKQLSIPVIGLRPLEEAISTVGGIKIEELNSNLSLKKIPNVYIAGEMFDWDTITGGFLLQGCFSTANYIAKDILNNTIT